MKNMLKFNVSLNFNFQGEKMLKESNLTLQNNTQKEKTEYKKMRRGFTLIELAFVAIILATLVAIVVATVTHSSKSTELSSVERNDLEQIVKAAAKWKMSDSNSTGNYNNITTDQLCAYLPANMKCPGDGYIYSSGFNGGIKYQVLSSKINTDGDSFKILADSTDAADANHWDDKTKQIFEKMFANNAKKMSLQPDNVTIDFQATAIGDANDNFDDTDGTNNDGKAGVLGIVE